MEPAKITEEQMAEANKRFEARLKADPIPTGQPAGKVGKFRPNPRIKKVGESAGHTHVASRGDELYDKECLYVEHLVNDPKGFLINEVRYVGKVLVPQCVANDLSHMQTKTHASERAIALNQGRKLYGGSFEG